MREELIQLTRILGNCLFRLVLTIMVTFFMCFSPSRSSAAPSDGPRILMFSAIDIEYLSDSLRRWGQDIGINGFILSNVADWWSTKDHLSRNLKLLTEINRKGGAHGIDSNFIKVALGYRELPLWTDDHAWSQVIDNFRIISGLIRESGTRGIAIDTEKYNVDSLFNPESVRFRAIAREELRRKIYERGRQLMQALSNTFPDIEVILFPEGHYYRKNGDKEYEHWIDFFNGMASVRNRKGIVLATESTYSIVRGNKLLTTVNDMLQTMAEHVADPNFWKDKCSIAIGMWPLGKTYSDKSARYLVRDFKEQFSTAVAVSPKYVWIYDHGAAWFQLSEEEAEKYTRNGRWIWKKKNQMLPTTANIQGYYEVLREYQRGLRKRREERPN
jgi:hypothetical protein